MTILFSLLVLAVAAIALRRLFRMRPGDFAEAETELALERYFSGHLRGWGLFEDRFGRVRRQFSIDSTGQLFDTTLQIDQTITFEDGSSHQRVWSFRRLASGRYVGTANDVIGEATGASSGNTLKLTYAVRRLLLGLLPQRAEVEDWMFLQPDGVVIQRARVAKWGFTVGWISAFYIADA
ncbi:MAG: hypothetical protein RLZZ501_2127 [Pseudomonadota bacterium]|jgi:hypothetical protein